MLFYVILAAISANTLVLAHTSLDGCFSNRSLVVDARNVADELEHLEKAVDFLNHECDGKPCYKRDYSSLVNKQQYNELILKMIGDIIGAFEVDQPVRAMQECSKVTKMLSDIMVIAVRKKSADTIEQIEKARTLVSFFKSEAYRLIDEYGEASDRLDETVARNGKTHAISKKEIKKSRALIELGKIAQFNSDVNLLLGLKQEASLEQVRSAYANGKGRSTQPLEDIVDPEVYEQIISTEQSDLCEFAQKLTILETAPLYAHLYEEALVELREFDDEFAQLVEKDLVAPLKSNEPKKAHKALMEIASSLSKEDASIRLKKLYDVRNIWSKENRDNQKNRLTHLITLRTYLYYFLAGYYSQMDDLPMAAKIIDDMKEDRIDHAGVSADKLLRLQAKVVFRSAIKLNKA